MDVKSLFKSGKKTIKAFKVATGPTQETKEETKPADAPLEAWEAPAAAKAAPAVSVGVDDYKAETDQSTAKPSVSWSADVPEPAATVEKTVSASAYRPPSYRRAESTSAMPTLADAAKLAAPAPAKAAAGAGASAGGPTRIKLITAASKKAQEEEENKKEEEKKRKEAEKQARKEQLKAEMERQESGVSSAAATGGEIKAASLEQVYAKYVGRAKSGRKLAPSA